MSGLERGRFLGLLCVKLLLSQILAQPLQLGSMFAGVLFGLGSELLADELNMRLQPQLRLIKLRLLRSQDFNGALPPFQPQAL